MKVKSHISYVLMAITILWYIGTLTSCTKQEITAHGDIIRLGAITHSPAGNMRASIGDLAGLSAAGDKVGIIGVETSQSDPTQPLALADWAVTPLMNNVQTTAIHPVTGAISWQDIYSYPQQQDRYVKFMAYHPYAPIANVGTNYVSIAPAGGAILNFTITGSQDIMHATPVTGNKLTAPGPLSFNHKLTQLKFTLTDPAGNFTNAVITGIWFTGVNTTASMNLETGAVTSWATPSDAVRLETSYPITVNAVSTSQELAGEIMLEPGQSSFRMRIQTDRGDYNDIEITPTGEPTFAEGKSYMITLRFRDRIPVQLSATVVPWITGGYGEGEVQ